MTNDLKGFTTFLRGTKIECKFGKVSFPGRVHGSDEIECADVRRLDLEPWNAAAVRAPPSIYHCHVSFGGTILRLDNDSDYYFSFFDLNRDCGGVNGTDRECIACTWSTDNVVRHLRRCSAGNLCTGSVEWYDARNAVNFTAIPAEDGGQNNSSVPILCPEASVQSVEPLSAPWAGGVTVKIAVKNHRILAENRTIAVTLAGRYCAYPTVSDETIACTVSPTARTDEPAEGPVVVAYSGEGRHTFTIASTQRFQFVMPEVLGVSPKCGPLEGGTVLTVVGKHLNTGSTVHVSLGENRTCNPVERLENRIVCLTSPASAPIKGEVSVMFDKSLSRSVEGQLFTYTSRPTLNSGQRLGGIASGGTTVSVRGAAFSCVQNASFYVELNNGQRWYSECRVQTDSSMVCRSPELTNVSLSSATATSVAASSGEVPAAQQNARPTALKFGVRVYVVDHEHDLSSEPGDVFDVYTDPVFDSFEIVNGSVVITGVGDLPDHGYQKEDVTVRFPSNSDVKCTVTSVAHNQIVCVSSAPGVVHKLREIVVTVGDKFVSIVNWKTGTYDGYKLFSALSGSVLLTGIVLLCLRTLRQANIGGRTPLFEMKVPEQQKNIAM